MNIDDIKEKCGEVRTPYQNVFLQECEYMNILLREIHRQCAELELSFAGKLTSSEIMDRLKDSLKLEKIPPQWQKLAYPAKRSLASWFDNLLRRIEQLHNWRDDPSKIPKVTRLNMLFNPQSFLTAIKQITRKAELNKLYIKTEFQKSSIEEIKTEAQDGAYCYGFLLEGARWDWANNTVEEARPLEMFSVMPVCLCKSEKIKENKKAQTQVYQCPVYRTEQRGPTYIFTAQLRTQTKFPPAKWILAGVAIVLDVEGISDEVKKEKKN